MPKPNQAKQQLCRGEEAVDVEDLAEEEEESEVIASLKRVAALTRARAAAPATRGDVLLRHT